jgi:glutaconate CoA-transferase subunit B
MTKPAYNTAELVTYMSARALEDGKIVFAGAGMPLLACILAQKLHAPRLTILFEGGVIGPHVEAGKLPPSTNEQRCARRANMLLSIDQYGNLNSSFIGDPESPKVRLPGTGGANSIASLSSKILVAMHHERKRFVEKVDFITTPGYLQGQESREKAGLTVGGVHQVITHLGLFGFDKKTRKMQIEALHPGASVEEVRERTGFELIVPRDLPYTEPPAAEELRILPA